MILCPPEFWGELSIDLESIFPSGVMFSLADPEQNTKEVEYLTCDHPICQIFGVN
jgi:hypothetical protein